MGHPEAIRLSEAEDFNRVFLQLQGPLSTLYFRTVVETDEAIREYLFKVSSDKLKEDKKAAKLGRRGVRDHGRVQR